MAVRRRKPVAKAGPAPTARVHAVQSLEQWENMLAKAGSSNRLVVAQIFQTQNYACAQMRVYYKRMSVDPALRGAVFAEIEVDQVEDDLLEACGVRQGVTKIPAYLCYAGGVQVDSYAGGVPAQVVAMIQRQLAELRGSGPGLLARLLMAAGVAAALGAALYWRFGRGGGGAAATGDLGEELRSLGERINIAQQRMRNAERAGKLKAAKNQRRIVHQLRTQQRALEQQLQKREAPVAASSAHSGSSKKSGSSGGKSRRAAAAAAQEGGQAQAPQRRRRASADYSSDEEAASARSSRGSAGASSAPAAVVYSDEEE